MAETQTINISKLTLVFSPVRSAAGTTHNLTDRGLFPYGGEEVSVISIDNNNFKNFLLTLNDKNNKAYFSKYFNGTPAAQFHEALPFMEPKSGDSPQYNPLSNPNLYKMNRCFTKNMLFPSNYMIEGGEGWTGDSNYISCSQIEGDIIFRVTLTFEGYTYTNGEEAGQSRGQIFLLLTCISFPSSPSPARRGGDGDGVVHYLAVKEVKIELSEDVSQDVSQVVVYDNIYPNFGKIKLTAGGGKRRKCSSMKKRNSCNRRRKCSWTKKSKRSRGHCRKSNNRRKRSSKGRKKRSSRRRR